MADDILVGDVVDVPVETPPVKLPGPDWVAPRARKEGETDDTARIAEALAVARQDCECKPDLPNHEIHYREGKVVAVRLVE